MYVIGHFKIIDGIIYNDTLCTLNVEKLKKVHT